MLIPEMEDINSNLEKFLPLLVGTPGAKKLSYPLRNTMTLTKRQQNKADKLVEASYKVHGVGVQIDIMDIGKIYNFGRDAYDPLATEDFNRQAVDTAVKAAVNSFRINR